MPRWGCQGKAGEIVLRAVAAEVVHHEERIEVGRVAEAEGAPQAHAGAFDGRPGLAQALDGTNGHGKLRMKIKVRRAKCYRGLWTSYSPASGRPFPAGKNSGGLGEGQSVSSKRASIVTVSLSWPGSTGVGAAVFCAKTRVASGRGKALVSSVKERTRPTFAPAALA